MKLNVKAFALTCGILWGLGLFFLTWWMIAFDGATGDRTWIGRIYIGYHVNPVGSLIGLVWGLLDGFIGGVLFVWVYNLFVRRAGHSNEA